MITFDKKPTPSHKDQAMALLPAGTKCIKTSRYGRTLYAVVLPNAQQIAEESRPQDAWLSAKEWAESQS